MAYRKIILVVESDPPRSEDKLSEKTIERLELARKRSIEYAQDHVYFFLAGGNPYLMKGYLINTREAIEYRIIVRENITVIPWIGLFSAIKGTIKEIRNKFSDCSFVVFTSKPKRLLWQLYARWQRLKVIN